MVESLSVGPLGERCYILPYGKAKACLLVDPGDEAKRILGFLDKAGLLPSCVVATHGHLDHTAAIPDILAAFSARGIELPIAVHAQDAAYFGHLGEATNRATFTGIRALGFFRHYWRPLPEASIILDDGATVGGDESPWRVIHSPGHTMGSICLYDGSEGLLVSGDTLFQDGVGRTDGPDSDAEALMRSLARLCALPDGTIVYPGHGEATTIGYEKAGLGLC